MDLGITGKVALVMGASKGIGRGIAAALARDGARLAISSRSPERIESTAAALAREHSADVTGFAADTEEVDALGTLVEEVRESIGPVEILVTNTGGPPIGEPLAFERDDWERAYRSLVLAPMALVRAVVPEMRKRGWGRIVNVTSISTIEPLPGLVLSNSHRMATVGAFKTLANELAGDGILVNSVAPGRIATDRIAHLYGKPADELLAQPQPDVPAGRIGTVEEFGDVVAFLCSERASYVSGVNLPVDGGLLRSA